MAARLSRRHLVACACSLHSIQAISCHAWLHTGIAHLAATNFDSNDIPDAPADQKPPIGVLSQPPRSPKSASAAPLPRAQASAQGQVEGSRPRPAPSGSDRRQQPGGSQNNRRSDTSPREGLQPSARPSMQMQRPPDVANRQQQSGRPVQSQRPPESTDCHTTMTGSQALAGIQTTSKVTGTVCKEVSSRTEAQLTQPIGFQAICKGTFCGTRAHLTQHAAILISLSSDLGLSRTGHPQRKTTTGLSLEMTAACQGKGSVCLGNPGSQDPRSWAWALLAAAMMLIQMTHIKTTESLGEDKNPAVLAAESAPLPPGQRGDLLGSTPEEVGQPRVPKCSGHLILACQMN